MTAASAPISEITEMPDIDPQAIDRQQGYPHRDHHPAGHIDHHFTRQQRYPSSVLRVTNFLP